MERLTRSQAPQIQQQQTGPQTHEAWTPERAYPQRIGLTAQLALDGASLFDMPPQAIERLAALIGNSAMQALLDAQRPPLEQTDFQMPVSEPCTAPFQTPSDQPIALADPAGLTALPFTGAPAALGSLTI